MKKNEVCLIEFEYLKLDQNDMKVYDYSIYYLGYLEDWII